MDEYSWRKPIVCLFIQSTKFFLILEFLKVQCAPKAYPIYLLNYSFWSNFYLNYLISMINHKHCVFHLFPVPLFNQVFWPLLPFGLCGLLVFVAFSKKYSWLRNSFMPFPQWLNAYLCARLWPDYRHQAMVACSKMGVDTCWPPFWAQASNSVVASLAMALEQQAEYLLVITYSGRPLPFCFRFLV